MTVIPMLILVGMLGLAPAALAHTVGHHPAKPRKSPAAAKPAPAPEADWFPDPALTPQLGTETSFGAYTLRLPAGVSLAGQRRVLYRLHLEDISKYEGAPRPDGSRLVMFVDVASARPGAFFTSTAAEMISHIDDQIFEHTVSPLKSPNVYGRINGLETLRQYFKMNAKGVKTHGFQYWMLGPTSAIVVVAADAEPHNTDTLPLAESAALTLNKQ